MLNNPPQYLPVSQSSCTMSRAFRIWAIAAIFLFIPGFSSTAQTRQPHLKVDRLTLEHGLSQSTIMSIAQDQEGFMWFGTIDGLNKFDGYKFTIYRNNPADSNSLADDWITAKYPDREGTLWVATLTGGLNRFDPATGKFTRFCLDSYSTNMPLSKDVLIDLPFLYSSLNFNSITSICEDQAGNLWLGTFGSGLFMLDRTTNEIIHHPVDLPETNGLHNYILSICETSNAGQNILWLGTYGGGLVKLPADAPPNAFIHNPQNTRSLSDNQILTLAPDKSSKHILWVGTLGGGLEKFNLETTKFQHFMHDPVKPHSLSGNSVLSILQDSDGTLWIGTLGNGLNRLSPGEIEQEEPRFGHYFHDPSNPNSLSSNEVLSLFEDRTGIIWIGTNLGTGISKIDRRGKKFRHFFHDPSNPKSLSENNVFTLFEDRAGTLWVGTFQNGLNRFDRNKMEFIHYHADAANPNSLSDNRIRSIYEDRSGIMWIGSFYGGLCRFDKNQNRFRTYKYNPDDPQSLSANYVWSIYEDRSGNLWIGTKGGGLNKFNRRTEKFTRYQHDPNDPASLGDNRISSICEDSTGILWLGTFGDGLNRFDPQTEVVTHYKHNPQDMNSLNDNRIMALLPDPDDCRIFWLGTYGGGLDKLILADTLESPPQNYKVVHYTKKDGLPNNVIYGILSDDAGQLWLSTNRGISRFNRQTETFTNYELSDGLQGLEFNAGAYHKSQRTGEMFFGGINGYNSFFPHKIQVNKHIPPVVLTSFKVFDQEMTDVIGQLSAAGEIELSYKDNFFSFEFSALDYTDIKKNQFSFKLEGLNEDWIKCGTRRFASFTNLEPGNYTFRVKGSNSDGIWNEAGIAIPLVIHPPFWRQWWFRVLGILIAILTIIIIHQYRLKVNIKRSVAMERIRIAENERIRKAVAADFHDELGQKLTRIALFSEIIKRRLKKDFSKNLEYAEKINRVAKELSSHTRDFIWILDPEQDSLYDMAVYLKDFGDDMFDKTGIVFRVNGIESELKHIRLPITWRRHITLIFKEAMDNAFKHAECNNIAFDIRINRPGLVITLRDDGIGWDGAESEPDHGIHTMKQRAKSVDCRLHIFSQNDRGTTIQLISKIPPNGLLHNLV